MNKTKVAYKPVGMLLSVAAGAVSGMVYHQLWRAFGHGDAPQPTDQDRGWGEVLAAAALHGVVFAVVKAAVDRGGAQAVRRLTGSWPG